MTNIHIIGKPRSGKGILMTMLALEQADQGVPVYSNYHLKSENAKMLDFYGMLEFLDMPRQEPQHLLNLDELPGWCDSYVTTSEANRYATHFCNQAAKLGYDLLFSSQRSKRADINFRENTEFKLRATMKRLCDRTKCLGDVCENFFACHVHYDWLNVENDDEDEVIGSPLRVPFELAANYWHRYDTFEPVKPVGLRAALQKMQKYDPKRHNEQVNKLVGVIRECWLPSYTLDNRTIKDLLLEQGEPLDDADLVFSRFRRTRSLILPKQEKPIPPPENNNQQYSNIGWLQPHKATE